MQRAGVGGEFEESDCGDNERLSMLGEKVLDTAVTFTLFNKKPLINAQEIEVRYMHCRALRRADRSRSRLVPAYGGPLGGESEQMGR